MKDFKRVEPTIVETAGGKYKRAVVTKTFQSDDGKLHEFTTIYHEGTRAAGVIALTPDKQVIVVHQFRPGAERWLYELPGGALNPGEDPEAGMLRELEEETGYRPGAVTFLGQVDAREAYINGVWFYYLATDCVLLPDGAKLDHEEAEQGIETTFISIDQLITNAKTSQMSDQVAVLMAYEQLQEIKHA